MAAAVAAPLIPSTISAQVRYGGHLARAQDAFGGTTGIGVRAGVGLPLFPIEILAGGEYYFPGCDGDGGCGFSGLSADANVRLPMALLNPYVTGGWVVRRIDPGGGVRAFTRSGIHLGAGIGIGLAGTRVFGEGRYEVVKVPERQLVLRLGILLGG